MMFKCIDLNLFRSWSRGLFEFKPICIQTLLTRLRHLHIITRKDMPYSVRGPWFPGGCSHPLFIKSTFWLNVKIVKIKQHIVNLSDGVCNIEFIVNRIYSRIRHNRVQSCVILNDRKHIFFVPINWIFRYPKRSSQHKFR